MLERIKKLFVKEVKIVENPFDESFVETTGADIRSTIAVLDKTIPLYIMERLHNPKTDLQTTKIMIHAMRDYRQWVVKKNEERVKK